MPRRDIVDRVWTEQCQGKREAQCYVELKRAEPCQTNVATGG